MYCILKHLHLGLCNRIQKIMDYATQTITLNRHKLVQLLVGKEYQQGKKQKYTLFDKIKL